MSQLISNLYQFQPLILPIKVLQGYHFQKYAQNVLKFVSMQRIGILFNEMDIFWLSNKIIFIYTDLWRLYSFKFFWAL